VFTARFGEDEIDNENNKRDFSFAEHMLDTNHKSESTKKPWIYFTLPVTENVGT